MNKVDLLALEARISGKPARYVGLARVKNECDVIETFVRYHLRLFDHLVVMDNASQDATATILDQLVAEGLPLTLIRDETLEFRQSEIITHTARACFSTFSCDRIFLLDADEFVHAGSRLQLEEALSQVPGRDHALIGRQTYVPLPIDADSPSILKRITHRRRFEKVESRKVILSRSFVDDPAGCVTAGNRDVANGENACTPVDLNIAHFPIRGSRQLQIKAALSWNSYLAMGYDIDHGVSHEWRHLSDAFLLDHKALALRLDEIAYGYPGPPQTFTDADLISDPLVCPDELVYLKQARPDPLATIAAAGRTLAQRYGSLRGALDAVNMSLGETRERLAALERAV